MREILFRGKRKNNRGWICGSLVKKVSGVRIISESVTGCIADYTEHEVYPETVCQYTGLTDKNGRKIFEGDIVKNEYGYIGIVKWECCSFVLGWLSWSASMDLYVWSNTVEVIGNIFDNPELIGE